MISGMLCIVIALGLLMLPIQWMFAVVIAAGVHELSHYLMIRLCGGTVTRFRFGVKGAKMEVTGLAPWQELLCALAGPLGGAALMLLSRWIPRVAICGMFQTLYNLLPVYPLDGGRVLRCGLESLGFAAGADRVCDLVELTCLFGLAGLGFYGCFVLRLGLIPMFASVAMVLRIWRRKIPCKVGADSVQ